MHNQMVMRVECMCDELESLSGVTFILFTEQIFQEIFQHAA